MRSCLKLSLLGAHACNPLKMSEVRVLYIDIVPLETLLSNLLLFGPIRHVVVFVSLVPRPIPRSQCNIENVGWAWGQG